MHLLSRLVDLALHPLAWVLLLLAAGVFLLDRRRTAARRLLVAALAVLLVQGWRPLPDALLRHLESRYPAVPDSQDLGAFAGVIVMGGASDQARLWLDHGQAGLNDAAERLIAPLPMLRRYPGMKLLFTGGDGALLGHFPSEAVRVKGLYERLGVPADRLLLEDASRNTFENAAFSAKLPGVDPTRPWLLVTTASHMPRSMAAFTRQGWNVTAYPVDYLAPKGWDFLDYSLIEGARHWGIALHELAGLLAYRLTGRA